MITEVDYFESLIFDDGLPLDEDMYIHDHDYDELQVMIEEHKSEEDYINYLINTGEV